MITKEEALKSWRDIRDDVKDVMSTYDSWDKDFSNVENYITQPTTLDKVRERILKAKNDWHDEISVKEIEKILEEKE